MVSPSGPPEQEVLGELPDHAPTVTGREPDTRVPGTSLPSPRSSLDVRRRLGRVPISPAWTWTTESLPMVSPTALCCWDCGLGCDLTIVEEYTGIGDRELGIVGRQLGDDCHSVTGFLRFPI